MRTLMTVEGGSLIAPLPSAPLLILALPLFIYVHLKRQIRQSRRMPIYYSLSPSLCSALRELAAMGFAGP